MHVAIAAHDLYPDPGSGGSGRYVYETGRRLVERGHDVSVLTRRRGDVPRRETVAGVDVFRYDLAIAERSAPSILRQLPGSLRRVAAHVDALESGTPPDVLSLQGPLTGPLLSALASDAIPRSCTFHSAWPTEYRIRTRSADRSRLRREGNAHLRRAIEGRTLSACDGIVTLSAFVRDRLLRTYDDVPEPLVIPGGVDLDRYAPDAAATGPLPVEAESAVETAGQRVATDGSDPGDGPVATDESNPSGGPVATDGSDPTVPGADRPAASLAGDPAFLTVRRLSERMGHELLLEAFATVRDRHPAARLYVAGDGPLRGRLERTASRLGVADAVTFLGYVPDESLPATYAAADCFVLPTTELEGFGLATLEALAAGTPVLGTPVGATPAVIGGLPAMEGFRGPALARSVDAAGLADGMDAWAALSPAELDDAGRACRRFVERRYPWDRTVSSLERHFRELGA